MSIFDHIMNICSNTHDTNTTTSDIFSFQELGIIIILEMDKHKITVRYLPKFCLNEGNIF